MKQKTVFNKKTDLTFRFGAAHPAIRLPLIFVFMLLSDKAKKNVEVA
jgi:hypothetical protein